MKAKVARLKAIAKSEAGNNPRLFDTVIKEALHRDILSCMSKSGLASDICFQGGTALRLCYGNNRYSEDLDFVSSKKVDEEKIAEFKRLISEQIVAEYGVEAEFKNPKQTSGNSNASGIDVKRWSIKIELGKTIGGKKTKQKIHIEIAEGIPALDAQPRAVRALVNIPEISTPPIIMMVSSMEEILADKVVAIMGRPYLKARDIWDIKFLRDNGVKLNSSWVVQKVDSYAMGLSLEGIKDKLNQKIIEIAQPKSADKFKAEMSRFLGQEEAKNWIGAEYGTESILMEVCEFLEQAAVVIAESGTTEKTTKPDLANSISTWRDKHTTKKDIEP